MYSFLVRILFLFSPERAHAITMVLLSFLIKIPGIKPLLKHWFVVEKPVTVFGLTFKNRVGLAAGFDKNAKHLDVFEALGFGFVEIGTVTPKAQPGNPKPRSFRLVKDKALINRMGFNNDGMDVVYERLKNRKASILIGGNIGKNKVTPNEEAVNDYALCFERLYDVCDYFVVNVSSPNTPGLRALQDKDELQKILSTLLKMRYTWVSQGKVQKPLLLKIAPDLTHEQLDEVAAVTMQTGIDGLIATNTTIAREPLTTDKAVIESIGAGGLSGAPLTRRSTDVLQYLATRVQVPIIATGGVMSTADAREKILHGAALVQLYSGFIYSGPALVRDVALLQV